MKVLADTNILFAFLDEKMDFIDLIRDFYMEVDFYVLKQSLDEIKAKRPAAIEPIMWYLDKNKVKIIGSRGKADELILEWATGQKGVVTTKDFALKKRLKKAGVQVISLKNNKLVL